MTLQVLMWKIIAVPNCRYTTVKCAMQCIAQCTVKGAVNYRGGTEVTVPKRIGQPIWCVQKVKGAVQFTELVTCSLRSKLKCPVHSTVRYSATMYKRQEGKCALVMSQVFEYV